jgi:PhzF family phenazine biosynthesis protein
MKLKIYQVDAFTDQVFSGNPAAVCPLSAWLPDSLLQNIALENNLSETAFYVKQGNEYLIRWFTPTVEVDLCGHATLATAHVLFNHERHASNEIIFHSNRSGILKVSKNENLLTLDFPTDVFQKIEWPIEMNSAFNFPPKEIYKGKTDYMLVFENEEQIRNIQPNYPVIATWKVRGVIVTARGMHSDFVSRFFGPQSGVNEDPVTGSAHTTLTPFWAEKLGKTKLSAIQLSDRRGYLTCEQLGNRVLISGEGKTYLIGEIEVA